MISSVAPNKEATEPWVSSVLKSFTDAITT
jgi:hypothetical protein